MQQQYSLSQLTSLVSSTFDEFFGEFGFWCECEVSKVQERGKHAYLDLVEYDKEGKILAKMKGNMFFATKVCKDFLEQTKLTSLEQITGSKILFHGHFSFHAEYGMSIIIDELSSEYTLGYLHKKQEDILMQLQKLGIAEKNKQTILSVPPLNVALVTSATSAGREDFMTVLQQSGYTSFVFEYHAVVHGNTAQESVFEELKKIYVEIQRDKQIDVIVILRGGGDSTGMSWQNDIAIAKAICHMPVPVIVAIGHTTDKFVLDEIAYYAAKTPTEAAYYLIEHYNVYKKTIQKYLYDIQYTVKNRLEGYKEHIPLLYEGVQIHTKGILSELRKTIHMFYEAISSISPENIVQYGYALVLKEDRYLDKMTANKIQIGDELTIKVYDKTLRVEVKSDEESLDTLRI